MNGTVDQRFTRVRDVFAEGFASQDPTDLELGASVSVMLEGKLVVDLHAGFLDKAKTRPWQADSVANVFSVTKGFTAMMAHRLVDQGKLDLDKPVSAYWPEFAANGKEDLRVKSLLDHRAGLPAIREMLPMEALFDWTTVTTALANEKPWWEPDTQHGYHAVTYGWLVGEVIRRASGGKTPGAYFRDEIAGPLGISESAMIGFAESEDARCADLRFLKRDPKSSSPAFLEKLMAAPESMAARAFSNPPALVVPHIALTRQWRGAELPSVNGHTNANALARLYGALANGGGAVLSKQSIDELRKERSHGPDAILDVVTRFGLGFMLNLPHASFGPNEGSFGHPGMGGSLGFADPTAKIGFGYVTNMLGTAIQIDPRATRLINALHECL